MGCCCCRNGGDVFNFDYSVPSTERRPEPLLHEIEEYLDLCRLKATVRVKRAYGLAGEFPERQHLRQGSGLQFIANAVSRYQRHAQSRDSKIACNDDAVGARLRPDLDHVLLRPFAEAPCLRLIHFMTNAPVVAQVCRVMIKVGCGVGTGKYAVTFGDLGAIVVLA